MRWSYKSVIIHDDRVVRRRFLRAGRVFFYRDVVAASAFLADMITYDEVMIRMRVASGEAVSVGQLDQGFATLVRALESLFGPFPAGWFDEAEEGGHVRLVGRG